MKLTKKLFLWTVETCLPFNPHFSVRRRSAELLCEHRNAEHRPACGEIQFMEYAKDLVKKHGSVPAKLLPALVSYDEAIATQAASFYRNNGKDSRDETLATRLKNAPPHIQRGFAAYNETLSAEEKAGGTN